MGYKEKYEVALERARQIHNEGKAQCFDVMTKVFPELGDNENDRIRQDIITTLSIGVSCKESALHPGAHTTLKEAIDWLEKQGDKDKLIQDLGKYKVKYTQEVLEKHVNSMSIKDDERLRKTTIAFLKDFAEQGYENAVECIDWLEKQGEQVPTEKIEPKFKVGDWISHNTANFVFQVVSLGSCGYEVINRDNHTYIIPFDNEDNYHLWTIQDAKDGDVLAAHECIVLFKEIDGLNIKCHCTYHFMNSPSFCVNTLQNKSAFHPATKEQRDLLFKKMKEAGYMWDYEKKELKKIEQMSALKEENEYRIKDIIYFLDTAKKHYASTVELDACINWLKSLRIHSTWKPSDEQMQALSDASNSFRPFEEGHKVLWSLYNDLKKLREE